jgi:tRNA (adenine37-N6)-methyltransferase
MKKVTVPMTRGSARHCSSTEVLTNMGTRSTRPILLPTFNWVGDFCGLFPRISMEVETGSRMFTSQPIGFVSSPYKDTKEIPKGLGAKHDMDGVLKILPEFELGLTDIEGFSHLLIVWEFDRAPREELRGNDLLASPPSDNRKHGVFATRSPRRPNPIGLTVVELLRRDGVELHVRGVDMLDATPVLDIKPYLSSIPPERLRRGWLAEAEARQKR